MGDKISKGVVLWIFKNWPEIGKRLREHANEISKEIGCDRKALEKYFKTLEKRGEREREKTIKEAMKRIEKAIHPIEDEQITNFE
jgi:AAA+ ATPase superfamily predicted ATPase